MGRCILLAALLLVMLPVQATEQVLTLYTYEAPPYQTATDSDPPSDLMGTTVSTLNCVLREMDWTARMDVVPKRRGQHELIRGRVDGFFSLERSREGDLNARATNPIALEKWYLFSSSSSPSHARSQVGVLASSNQQRWLEEAGYEHLHGVSSQSQLLSLLDFGRVDAIMSDWKTVAYQYQRLSGHSTNATMERLEQKFLQFSPQHLYLSNAFLEQHPDFITRFNRFLPACVTTHFELTPFERERIQTMSTSMLADLASDLDLEAAVRPPGFYSSYSELLVVDHIWKAMSPEQPSMLAERVLAHPISQQLALWQRSQQGLVTEIFLMDSLGALTASSQLTSDFWQADERKYQDILDMTEGELLIKPLYFDESTSRFQIMLASPIRDDEGEFLGGVAFALDVEQTLRQDNSR